MVLVPVYSVSFKNIFSHPHIHIHVLTIYKKKISLRNYIYIQSYIYFHIFLLYIHELIHTNIYTLFIHISIDLKAAAELMYIK